MKRKRLGASSLEVSAMGLGHSMGFQDFSEHGLSEFKQLVHRALALGMNFFDSSDAYWDGLHEEWLRQALGAQRHQAVVTSKFGNITLPDGSKATNARPEYVVSCCEASLKRLGTDCIDLYYLHRVDPNTPIEDTVGAMSRLVEQGKVRYLGICEAGVDTLTRAHRVHPMTALQTEFSLWYRDTEVEMIALCRQLNIAFVGYSPLGRGLLTGGIQSFDDLDPKDRRRIHPRFHGDNLAHNLTLVARMQTIADRLGLTTAQLAMAWTVAQGDDIVPITGTQRVTYLEQSVAASGFTLSTDDSAELEAIFTPESRAGERYPRAMLSGLGI
ncbi:aldo/keto reductase [Limnohabitans sp.]|uniref:aldo/keto reductase n=1 Tax=Limnohabitans sp. TaxID=1907725 RepID=UPI0038B833B6